MASRCSTWTCKSFCVSRATEEGIFPPRLIGCEKFPESPAYRQRLLPFLELPDCFKKQSSLGGVADWHLDTSLNAAGTRPPCPYVSSMAMRSAAALCLRQLGRSAASPVTTQVPFALTTLSAVKAASAWGQLAPMTATQLVRNGVLSFIAARVLPL